MIKNIKNLKANLLSKKNTLKTISVDEKDLKKVVFFLEDCKEFSCTKNNLGNLANHLEDGKEYVVLVKEVN